MRIEGFIWLDEIEDKLARKHHVSVGEVEEVFEESPNSALLKKATEQGRMYTWL